MFAGGKPVGQRHGGACTFGYFPFVRGGVPDPGALQDRRHHTLRGGVGVAGRVVDLDQVNHQASHNHSAVKCVVPLIVQCRRFWYAYQHEGEITEGARAHMELAEGIATGNESAAVAGANQLLDYLEQFARRVIDK